jgi:hypothetical protein
MLNTSIYCHLIQVYITLKFNHLKHLITQSNANVLLIRLYDRPLLTLQHSVTNRCLTTITKQGTCIGQSSLELVPFGYVKPSILQVSRALPNLNISFCD